MKMWSGRFRQPLDPQFERWQRSFDFDRRLLRLRTGGERGPCPGLEKCRSFVGGRAHQHSGRTAADWRDGGGF